MKKKIISILIVLVIVSNPVIVYADSVPGTITVSGGSIGSGGIEGGSNLLKGTALTVLMATLASVGVQVKLSMDDYQAGYSAMNYLDRKFGEWESNADQGWSAYQALNNTKVGQNGELYLSEEGQSVIDRFINWLKSENGIQTPVDSNPSVGVGGSYYGNSFTNPIGARYYFEGGQQGNIVAVDDGGIYYIVGFREGGMNRWCVDNGRFGNAKSSTTHLSGTNYYYCWAFDYSTTSIGSLFNISTLGYYGKSGFQAWLRGDPQVPDINLETGFYGDVNDIPSLVDTSGTGKITVVQPGLMPQVQDNYANSNDTVVGVSDYLDALRDLYGQQAIPQDITDLPDITLQGEDVNTGTKEDVAEIDRDTVLDPDITIPDDPISITWPDVPPIAVPVEDPDVPADPSVAIPAMSLDLRTYFPFCIPFDIYNLLSKLNAEPVTPVVNIDWGNILGVVGIDYVMTIDLHDYDGLASLLRTMELFGFVIGLGVATRSMYLRG